MFQRYFALLIVTTLNVACSRSSDANVPALNPTTLSAPSFPGLLPRALSIKVIDQRQPLRETSTRLVAELTRTLSSRFRSAGYNVQDVASPNQLVVVVANQDNVTSGFDRDGCAQLTAKLTLPRSCLEAVAVACNESHNQSGMSYGGKGDQTYQFGLSFLIQNLNRAYSEYAPL